MRRILGWLLAACHGRYRAVMEAPWLDLLRLAAYHDAGRPLVLALSTVDAAGNPQVRSMISRRLDDDGRLWLTTDSRSAKHVELSLRPNVAALAWFPITREQFRLNGRVELLGPATLGSARGELWRTLSPETRATFFWPHPGKPRDADEVFTPTSSATDPPASFAVLLLHPQAVEHLDLAQQPHRRRRWTWDGRWNVRELNP